MSKPQDAAGENIAFSYSCQFFVPEHVTFYVKEKNKLSLCNVWWSFIEPCVGLYQEVLQSIYGQESAESNVVYTYKDCFLHTLHPWTQLLS